MYRITATDAAGRTIAAENVATEWLMVALAYQQRPTVATVEVWKSVDGDWQMFQMFSNPQTKPEVTPEYPCPYCDGGNDNAAMSCQRCGGTGLIDTPTPEWINPYEHPMTDRDVWGSIDASPYA